MARVRGMGWIVGSVLGGGLVITGPLIGLIYTLLGLRRAFTTSGSPLVDPSEKARVLAEGISESMNGAAMGVVVALVGVIVLTVSLIGLFRANRPAGDTIPDA